MKKFIVLIVLISLFAIPVSAQMPGWLVWLFGICSDSDGGPTANKPLPFIALPGQTRDTSGLYQDTCVDQDGERVLSSLTVREISCLRNRATFTDYNCIDHGFAGCVESHQGAACISSPATCGNGVVDAGEQCDGLGTVCAADGVCNALCQCQQPQGQCGDGVLDRLTEQCDWGDLTIPENQCTAGSVCLPNCLCQQAIGFCGDDYVDSQAGEQCDPPGGLCALTSGVTGASGVSAHYCTNDCQCPMPPVQPPQPLQPPQGGNRVPVCGDGVLGFGEQCELPGSPSCPPVALPDGGCALSTCQSNCMCPVGDRCVGEELLTLIDDVNETEEEEEPPVTTPTPMPPQGGGGATSGGSRPLVPYYQTWRQQQEAEEAYDEYDDYVVEQEEPVILSCASVCSERGLLTSQPDHSAAILSQLNSFMCVNGARVTPQSSVRVTGSNVEGGSCTCYSSQAPSVEAIPGPVYCNTPCGNVACGSTAQCSCGTNCVLTVSCDWLGWQKSGDTFVPNMGAESQQEGTATSKSTDAYQRDFIY
ncbi:hypothetical protein COV18_00145 [Candidatus Woesearchaeota archaeon CG10_big_fil_rev_8_21_14_0_10_37_12]|nr:MAG: hypothetical protein COV18_00145 [Candidatus Woesearchaeota archaeon CG10_big_fil_rev_8_21_14_0_10_37_12]